MAGNKLGGIAAAATNKERYGEDFYSRIGTIGGKKSRGGGWAAMSPELRSMWGSIGGTKSKRKPAAYYRKGDDSERQSS